MTDKIRTEHLQRAAYVYVRQSSAHQVRFHREGQQRQYELAARARQLGFAQVVVIDDDRGRSGSGLEERHGFGRLLAAVCQGLVGAVLALEASRLARNNRDWHHLVDLCALTDTLLLDDDGIYDPRLLNDRLLLGLKGTMSEFELGLLRQRARAAFMQKVRRGCAMWEVPVGFVRGEDGRLDQTPDRQVQQALRMVLEKFRQFGSARQTLIWLREEGLLLPQAKPGSAGRETRWQSATMSRVRQILNNPCYGGAFCFGRTAAKTTIAEGRIRRSASRRPKPLEEWQILILNHHEGYISWAEYLENRQLMVQNLAQREGPGSGAAKRGAVLLSGLLRCGRCGRKLRVGYSGAHGEVGRYTCCGGRDRPGSGSCFSVGSLRVDAAVVAEVLEVVQPAGIEAACQARESATAAQDQTRQAVALALERARYEAARAQRQYDAVEPENRLVADELEARWNAALAQVAGLEVRGQDLATAEAPVSAAQKQRLLELGADLPRLWNDPQAPLDLKKRILRTVIVEIVINSFAEPAEHRLQIHWAGGVHTELRVRRTSSGMHRRMAGRLVLELVGELAKVCDDKTIAGVLNRLGYRTGQDNTWRAARVGSLRHTQGIAAFDKREGWLTLEETARTLQLSDTTVKRLIRKGILPGRQVVPCAPWVIEQSALAREEVQAAVRAIKTGRQIPPTVSAQTELTINGVSM